MPSVYAGSVRAPEFPAGLDWLNTERPLSLKDLRGKIVLLDFWTYCCINCMHVIPDLKKLEAKYPNELVVIGVHSAKFATEKETDNIRQAILRYELTHPVINDKDLLVWNSYGVNAWPSFVFLDPHGRVIATHSGENVYDSFDRFIAGAIAEFDAKKEIDRTPLKLRLERDRLEQTPLLFPGKAAIDPERRRLFVSDSNHNRIVAINLDSGAIVETIGQGTAGLKDGAFDEAEFFRPQGVALDGSTLYVADTENHAIRKIDLIARQVHTLAGTGEQSHAFDAGGHGPETPLNSPWDLLVHDGKLYIAMAGPHQLWTLDLHTLQAEVFAGSGRENIVDGPLKSAALAQPSGITTDGQRLYFADSEVSAVRQADLGSRGRVSTIIGHGLFDFGDRDGAVDEARLQHPLGVLYHDGAVYVADTYNHKIKRLDLKTHQIETIAGTGQSGLKDGPALQAQLSEPAGLAYAKGQLYITDTNNHRIRVLDLSRGLLETLKVTSPPTRQAAPAAHTQRTALPAQSVSAGSGTIELTITVPQGYKLNEAAPFYIALSADNAQVAAVPGEFTKRNITNPQFPLRVPVKFSPGKTALAIDLVVYYCQANQESVCLAKQIQAVLPLEVTSSAGSSTAQVQLRL